MKKHIVTCMLLLVGFLANGSLVPKIKKIVRQIAQYNVVDGKRIGIGGSLSEQYKRFEELTLIATTEQLKKLTTHKNAVVRCYAFRGLIEKGLAKEKIKEIEKAHEHDKARVKTHNGCIVWDSWSVADYMHLCATEYCMDPKLKQSMDSLYMNIGK